MKEYLEDLVERARGGTIVDEVIGAIAANALQDVADQMDPKDVRLMFDADLSEVIARCKEIRTTIATKGNPS